MKDSVIMKHVRTLMYFCPVVSFVWLLMFPVVLLAEADMDIRKPAFVRLEEIKNKKKEQISALLYRVEDKARAAAQDRTLLNFFRIMDRDKQFVSDPAAAPGKLRTAIQKYQRVINEYYLNSYLDFYDILFIDREGLVFHTIRKESDYLSNIFTGHLGHTGLVQCLKSPEHEFFIDFQYYSPAEEPAAFFLVRVNLDGIHRGWIVFQYSLNMLNALLVDYDELGDTGEVYIVNRDHFMLTQSRFKGDSSSLKVRVDTDAVRSALKKQSGQCVITGYRGTKVLVVFEQFRFWEAGWVIIASIEEAEILTDHYRKDPAAGREKLFTELQKLSIQPVPLQTFQKKKIKVDMDEFEKVLSGQSVGTRGVSTCTAITAAMPGRFGYLAHLSTHDKIYGSDNPLHTLKNMVRIITSYDIYLHEIRQLRFVVVANHTESFFTVVDKLLKYGIMFSQIKFAFNPEAHYANVTYDTEQEKTIIEWVYDGAARRSVFQDDSTIPSLDLLLQNGGV